MLTAGTRIGPYQILEKLGEGGMGEVHRARDMKLGRDVAVKLLPRTFAEDPERKARFEREARVLASLNHPSIAQIYGTEDADGATAIVMELVPGEDLARRIARGPVPWHEARPIARQLAVGLDAAHERGVIHRDLKPANVRLTPDDSVKILDFGLARSSDGSGAVTPDPALSPTFTSPATQLGSIVGTAAYMAPEQAKGRAVDKRADIWAFGVVVYEMLTGKSPFASDSAIESLGLVVTKDPDWNAIPPAVPSGAVGLLKRCLAKDPRERLRDIGDAIHVFDAAGDGQAAHRSAVESASRSTRLQVSALVVIAAAAAGALGWSLNGSTTVPLRRFELPDAVAQYRTPTISPDGRYLAYVADGKVVVRGLDEADSRELTSQHPTTGFLAWSPDSRVLAFFSEGAIHSVPVAGGDVFTVTAVPGSARINDLLWQRDGSILFSGWRDHLYRVSASGGSLEVALKIDPATEIDFHELSAAPGDRLVLGVHQRAENQWRSDLVRLGNGGQRVVLVDELGVRELRHVGQDRLLFRRLGANQGIWSIPFAERRLDLSRATPVIAGATSFTVSNQGTLIASSEASTRSRLEWLGRDGVTTDIPGAPIPDLLPSIAPSPDGDRVAYVAGRTTPLLFVRDVRTGADTRLTSETVGQRLELGSFVDNPGWFPGGTRVFYTKGTADAPKIVVRRADGLGEETTLGSGTFARASADGRWFAWLDGERGGRRLRYAPILGDTLGEVRTFDPIGKEDVRTFDFSSDGSLLVYSARGSNLQANIYLIDFPGGTARWQVTADGGTSPVFRGSANDVVFMTGGRNERGELEGRLMLMPLTQKPAVKLGLAKAVLTGAAAPNGFGPTRDGRLLIARRLPEPERRPRAVLVQNWPALVERR